MTKFNPDFWEVRLDSEVWNRFSQEDAAWYESAEDAARIAASGAEVKEMEAAAVAWVGSLHGVSVGAVKAVTDLVDSPVATAEQFTANLATAADNLRGVTLALLDRFRSA